MCSVFSLREGDDGMRAVSSVIMNRVNVPDGEFARVSQGGSLRNILEQPGQFDCMTDVLRDAYNAQNIWNMDPTDVHYDIADWALSGNILQGIDNSLFYFNPYQVVCPPYFPPGGAGVIHNRIHNHCFYIPTSRYSQT